MVKMRILLFGISLFRLGCFQEISHNWKRDHDFDNYIDTAHEVFYDGDTSLVECATLCGRITFCLSFFYHLLDRHCHGVSLEFGSSTGFTYLPNMGYYKDPSWVPTTTTTTTIAPTTPPFTGTCQSGYTYESTLVICWRLEKGVAKNYNGARSHCQGEGGDLLVLNTPTSISYMQGQLSSAMASIVYVGANDQAQEGTFKWLDNSPLTGPWGSLQPDNVLNQDCVVMEAIYGFKFNDVLCSNLYNFLCQTPVLTLADFCFPPYIYVSYLNICWRLNDVTSLTWDAARDACIAEGGDLLILHNDATVNYIKDQLTLASAGIVYVGAHDKTVEGSYVWVDNTMFGGTWGTGQPNNLVTNGEDQDCIIMESGFQYDFSDIYCSYPYKFLCQIKI